MFSGLEMLYGVLDFWESNSHKGHFGGGDKKALLHNHSSVTCAKGADVQSLPTSTRDGCIAKSILITQEMPHTALAKE